MQLLSMGIGYTKYYLLSSALLVHFSAFYAVQWLLSPSVEHAILRKLRTMFSWEDFQLIIDVDGNYVDAAITLSEIRAE